MSNLKFKIAFTLILSISQQLSLAQSINGRVYSVLNLGTLDYSYVIDDQEGVFYKTSAYQSGLLSLGSIVSMTVIPDSENEFNIQIRQNSSEVITAYATKIKKESFDMPLSTLFGMPKLENEILFFQDQNHFDEFYGVLNDFSTSPYEEQIDLLHVFEKQFPGFKSFNSHLEEMYNWEDGEFSEDEVSNRYKIDYFQDYLIKALVNEYAEIGIGNTVHTMIRDTETDECITFFVEKGNLNLIKEKRTLKFGELDEFSRINDLDRYHGGTVVNVFGLKALTYVLGTDEYDFPIELTYDHTGHVNNVNCSIFKKEYYVGVFRTCDEMNMINTANFSASVVINWGDGTTSSYDFPDFEGEDMVNSTSITKSHTYSSVGDFVISYVINLNSEHNTSINSNLPGEADLVNVGSTCSERTVNTPSRRIWIDGTYSMLCDAWINNWLIYKCVGSATEAWRKKSNGNLVKEKGNIQCSITAVYRNDNCDAFEDAYEFDSKFGKHVQTIVTKWWRKFDVANGDTFSFNYYERNNAIVQTSIPLNPCD